MKKTLFALHGFLGMTSDWNQFAFDCPLVAADLFKMNSSKGMHQTALELNDQAATLQGKRILLGYSLGGRLALQMLHEKQTTWDMAIIISANLGLSSLDEKKDRIRRDVEWAIRFKEESWDALMKSWDSQALFNNHAMIRDEKGFSRKKLAHALCDWSVATQQDFSQEINNFNLPILWIAGENDHSYVSQAMNLSLKHPRSKIWIAPKVGHRVPWEAPQEFERTINEFIKSN